MGKCRKGMEAELCSSSLLVAHVMKQPFNLTEVCSVAEQVHGEYDGQSDLDSHHEADISAI